MLSVIILADYIKNWSRHNWLGLQTLLPFFIKQEAIAACYRLRVSSQWDQNGWGYTQPLNALCPTVYLSRFFLVTGISKYR